MTPTLSSQTGFHSRPLPTGVALTNKAEGRRLEVGFLEDGVTLNGDGFSHSIRVAGDQVRVSRLDGQGPVAEFPKLPYLEDSRRVALGVAGILTGLPVNLFTLEKGEPIYANLAHRPGMGIRDDGSLQGGRYRVRELDHHLRNYDIHLPDGVITTNGQRHEYAPTTDLATRSGRPLSLSSAFTRMTGTHFAEAYQGTVADLWRAAGRPEGPGEAARVASYVFAKAYRFDPNYDIFQPTEQNEGLGQALNAVSDPAATWNILSEAASRGCSGKTLLKRLEA